ncbi:hypothetical protein [Nonomuraea rhodomycinica]|uniref:Uncharacterized protein n=1 Tax=Nonomuraea rhodomycinica TaxID=1712872 RepID=A0A7Y6IT27_9ACTN|nr:hypothetical protein [Nonomuraea rhodomycinica]NUW43901.1 hypothetical protein [Nonomuraea rhodomycinica]
MKRAAAGGRRPPLSADYLVGSACFGVAAPVSRTVPGKWMTILFIAKSAFLVGMNASAIAFTRIR